MTASAVCRPALSTMLNAMWSVPYWKTRVNNPKTTRQPPHSAQRGCVAPMRRASSSTAGHSSMLPVATHA